MQLTTMLSILLLSTATSAIPASPDLFTRAAYCGTFRDESLSLYSVIEGDNVDHEGTRCQPMQQMGEQPNDESMYHFYLEANCEYCKIYQDDQCTVQTMFVEANVKGVAWDFSHKRSAGAYFKC